MNGFSENEGVLVWDGGSDGHVVLSEGEEGGVTGGENEWREIEIGDSSEEELPDIYPVAQVSTAKGKKKEKEQPIDGTKSKPTKKSSKAIPSAFAAASPLPVETMPDYTLWTLPKLQAEVGKYGFKISKTKKVIVGQLQDCWNALHPPAPVEAVLKKARKKKVVEEEEEVDSIGEKLRKMILGEEELYLKILRYEVGLSLRYSTRGEGTDGLRMTADLFRRFRQTRRGEQDKMRATGLAALSR